MFVDCVPICSSGCFLVRPPARGTIRRENAAENIQRKAELVVGEILPDQAGVYQDLRGVVRQVSRFYLRYGHGCVAELSPPSIRKPGAERALLMVFCLGGVVVW